MTLLTPPSPLPSPSSIRLFTIFDGLTDKYGAQKVETAGDCYIAAAGILSPDDQVCGGGWV